MYNKHIDNFSFPALLKMSLLRKNLIQIIFYYLDSKYASNEDTGYKSDEWAKLLVGKQA